MIYGTMASGQTAFIISVREGQGAVTRAEVLPDEWGGKYVQHRIPMYGNMKSEWAFLSHIVCLESAIKTDGFMMFGPDTVIRNDFAVLWYSAERDAYYPLHCADCAIGIARYLAENQEAWAVPTATLQ